MFGRSKGLYIVLAIIYGLVAADLLLVLFRGDGSGLAAVMVVVFGGAAFLCIRTARRPSSAVGSQPRPR